MEDIVDAVCNGRSSFHPAYTHLDESQKRFVHRALINCMRHMRLTAHGLACAVRMGEIAPVHSGEPLAVALLNACLEEDYIQGFNAIIAALGFDAVMHRVWMYELFGACLKHGGPFFFSWKSYMSTWSQLDIMTCLEDKASLEAILEMHKAALADFLPGLLHFLGVHSAVNELYMYLLCGATAYKKYYALDIVAPLLRVYASSKRAHLNTAIIRVMTQTEIEWPTLCAIIRSGEVLDAVNESALTRKQLLVTAAKYAMETDLQTAAVVKAIANEFKRRPQWPQLTHAEALDMVSTPLTLLGMLKFGVTLLQDAPRDLTPPGKPLVYWLIVWTLAPSRRDIMAAMFDSEAMTPEVLAYLTEDTVESIHKMFARRRGDCQRLDFLRQCIINKRNGVSRLCIVCAERPRDYALVPCGHKCLCNECSASMEVCPLCREFVQTAIRIYE